MIRCIYLDKTDKLVIDDSISTIESFIQQKKPVWLDLVNPSPDEFAFITKNFNIHELSLEDSVSIQSSKIDIFEDHLFVILQSPEFNPEQSEIDYSKISFYLGERYLITIKERYHPVFKKFLDRLEASPQALKEGMDFLFYSLSDAIIDDYFPQMDAIEGQIDDIEELIYSHPDVGMLESIFALRRCLLSLRRVVSSQREIFRILSQRAFPYIRDQIEIYFKDIYDHLMRISDMVETFRDLLGGTLEISLAASTTRSNEVMKALTIILTILTPVTAVTSFWGMNLTGGMQVFFNSPLTFYFTLVFIVLFTIGFILYFKTKRWI